MTTITNYAVEPSWVDLMVRGVFALVPMFALTVVSVRLGRRWPWLGVLWGLFALAMIWLAIEGRHDAGTEASVVAQASLWLTGVWFASTVATVIYLVVLAVLGPPGPGRAS